ncbi:M23 family metallopeptidase [Cecembia calidifontis]|uniref:Peptidase M23-like protein n=1 Tax=Cecembia calidifontis TaxID=1187080 RepID=A0A4Q7P5L8_9BACT|nr:M23 family metallopeptidase [Cecembia calidifontis]RZS95027.1 peptidase M23-like protein [Cecembia calidifontis]
MKTPGRFIQSLKAKFLIVIRKEQDFSVITSFSISTGRMLSILALIFILIFGFSLIMSKTLLKAWFDPSYRDSENTALLFKMSETVDSLRLEVIRKDNYVKNIQRIISGETEIFEDQETLDTMPFAKRLNPEFNFEPSEATLSILQEMRGLPLEEARVQAPDGGFIGETYFFPPLKGVVTSIFDPTKDHFGIDVVAKENEPVKSIADGTVIFTSWTLGTGYVVAVQHTNELISIYKHNSVILKNIGDVVKGGEIISIIGNTGELTTGPHLHFEMWYKGSPLNPQDFISFN